jgi:hypothetical protein
MKKFFILFAATCIVSAAWADAVYEPLIVTDGFNRDVIAETSPYTASSVSYYLPYNSNLNNNYYKTYNHATKEVIRLTNDAENRGLTDEQKEYLATETGWPNDYGNPGDRIVNCLTDRYSGLYWELAPYTAENALCLRDSTSGCVNSGRFTFRNVGCYQKLYFLTFAGGVQDATKEDETSVAKRTMTTTVYYSTGEPDTYPFEFLDCAGVKPERQAHRCQIYSAGFVKGTSPGNTVYAAVSEMNVDTHRLIDSVHFLYNGSKSTGIAIFAVTGKVANIAAPGANAEPNQAPLRANGITENSFHVEWDPVEGAASYRIDVATDEDFHHMVEGFNNEAVITSPDTVITGLDADHEYYWRVRAVDSQGGQSASSAPRRVRTESIDGPKATNDDDHDLKTNDITPLLNTTTNLTINRKLYKDGYYNTLCLPFDQSAADLAETTNPLHGFTIYEFEEATKIGDAQLDIRVSETDHIEAGVPYLLDWPTPNDEVLTSLEFKGVTITTDEGRTIGEPDKVQFVGNISTTGENGMENGNHNHLFIGANNELFWPNTSNGLKGFRAHFEVPASGPAYVPRNSPARIVVQTNVATGVENTSANSAGAKKQLENGQLVIILDNIRYNVMGLKLR